MSLILAVGIKYAIKFGIAAGTAAGIATGGGIVAAGTVAYYLAKTGKV